MQEEIDGHFCDSELQIFDGFCEQAGHMQGQMIGEYLVNNYDKLDLNGDGKISYVMFKGQEGNMD